MKCAPPPKEAIPSRMLRFKFTRIGTNVAWLVADRLLRMLLGVAVLGLIARYLGPDQFGYLNYAVNLATIFASVASLGMEGIVIRELIQSPHRESAILGTAFCLRLIAGAGALVIVFVAGCMSANRHVVALVALITALAFFPQSLDVIDLWFQKNIQSKFSVMARTTATLLSSGVKLTLVVLKAPLFFFAVALVVEALLIGIAMVIVYRLRKGKIHAWSFSPDIARAIWRDAWPLMLSGVLVAAYLRVEPFLVMARFGPASAGLYFSAVRMNELWTFVPNLILASIYPLLVEKQKENVESYRQKLLLVFDLLTALGILVALGITVFGPYVLPLIYGDAFAPAIPVLTVLAWTAPVMFSGSVRAQYFLLEGLTIYHTISALSGMAVNVTLALCLMPLLGITGAAFAALSGCIFSALVTSWLFPRLRECARLQTRALLVFFRPKALVMELWPRHGN